jgi:hypothetical protein
MGSPAISALYRDYLKPMTPGPMIRDLLTASFDPEAQAPKLAEIIESNPIYSQYLQKLDILQEKIVQWREDFPEERTTERLTRFIVVLLGPVAIRNAVLAIWINRHAGQGLPRKEGVPFLVLPRMQLRFALKISEYCDDNQVAHADVAYLGGLCFDWVAALLEKKGGTAKSEKKYLEEIFPDAVKTARIAYELAHIPEKMELSHLVFPAVLLTYLGKVLMAASFPKPSDGSMGWRDFVKHCESHGPRARLAYRILERQKFAWTHSDAAALCSLAFTELAPAESAIRYYLEPDMLRNADPESYELSLLISTATTLARSGKAGLSADDKARLERAGISEAALTDALNRLKEKSK